MNPVQYLQRSVLQWMCANISPKLQLPGWKTVKTIQTYLKKNMRWSVTISMPVSTRQTCQGNYQQEIGTLAVLWRLKGYLEVGLLHCKKAHSSPNLNQPRRSFFQTLQQNRGLNSCKFEDSLWKQMPTGYCIQKHIIMEIQLTWFLHPQWNCHLNPGPPS